MNTPKTTILAKKIFIALLTILLLFSSVVDAQQSATDRSVKISSSQVNASNVLYEVSFTTDAAGINLGSVYLEFCENSPLVGDVCNLIPGFDISGTAISNQTGVNDFSIAPGATANTMLLTRPSSFVAGSTNITVELSGVHNPSVSGTFYGRIQIYPTTDASGPVSNEGGMTFAIEEPVNLSSWVPPWLFICVGLSVPGYYCTGTIESYLDLGELSSRYTSYGKSEIIVATNATDGYAIYVTGNTLTSGNNIINALSSPSPSAIGTSQFGINLRNNSQPNVGSNKVGTGSGTVRPNYNIVNRFMYQSGDTLASSLDTSVGEKYTVSYVVNVNNDQEPGVYTTTLIYTVLATF